MARRGSIDRGQRDVFDPSLEELLAPSPWPSLAPVSVVPSTSVWTEIEDRRLFNPERAFRSALSFSGNQARARRIPEADRRWSTVGFDNPLQAVICARRKTRREVLFAMRRRGRGGGRRRRNWWSNVRC